MIVKLVKVVPDKSVSLVPKIELTHQIVLVLKVIIKEVKMDNTVYNVPQIVLHVHPKQTVLYVPETELLHLNATVHLIPMMLESKSAHLVTMNV
jgi:hypothetical protein